LRLAFEHLGILPHVALDPLSQLPFNVLQGRPLRTQSIESGGDAGHVLLVLVFQLLEPLHFLEQLLDVLRRVTVLHSLFFPCEIELLGPEQQVLHEVGSHEEDDRQHQ